MGEYSTRNTLTRNMGNKVLKDKQGGGLKFGVRSVGFGKNVSPTLWEIKGSGRNKIKLSLTKTLVSSGFVFFFTPFLFKSYIYIYIYI
jgi:hypothetical protein